jgi:hypothetical protein
MAVPSVNGTRTVRTTLRGVFSFPHPVNEVSARVVAAMVVGLSLTIITTDLHWLMFVLAYGFLARVLTGPTLSPMGLLATRLIVPKVIRRSKLVAGPPKRFAQSVGLVFSVSAAVLAYGVGAIGAAKVVLGALVIFASLEAFVGFCTGCFVFGYLMRWGIIPESVCRACANLNFESDQA